MAEKCMTFYSLVSRPCAFVACGTKFAQRARNLVMYRLTHEISTRFEGQGSFIFLSFFVASRSGRVPLNSGMWLQLGEFSSEGLEFS